MRILLKHTILSLFFIFPILSFAGDTVDLIIEPNTYIPPFYQGKPYFPPEGSGKVIAIPSITIDGKEEPLGNLYFKWKINGLFPENGSGFGKNSILINSRIPIADIPVSIEILDVNMKPIIKKDSQIKLGKTKVLFYENSPLYGLLLNKSISNIDIASREEIKITALPYFFSNWSKLKYDWTINNQTVPSLASNEILLKQSENETSGSSQLLLSVRNPQKLLQSSDYNMILIKFGK